MENCPFVDGLPLNKIVIFHSCVNDYRSVNYYKLPILNHMKLIEIAIKSYHIILTPFNPPKFTKKNAIHEHPSQVLAAMTVAPLAPALRMGEDNFSISPSSVCTFLGLILLGKCDPEITVVQPNIGGFSGSAKIFQSNSGTLVKSSA